MLQRRKWRAYARMSDCHCAHWLDHVRAFSWRVKKGGNEYRDGKVNVPDCTVATVSIAVREDM